MSEQSERLANSLIGGGHRLTPARRAIIEALVDSHGHITADDLAATLRACGVDPALSAEVQRFLNAIEASRYSPAAGAAATDLRTEVGLLINQLDASL